MKNTIVDKTKVHKYMERFINQEYFGIQYLYQGSKVIFQFDRKVFIIDIYWQYTNSHNYKSFKNNLCDLLSNSISVYGYFLNYRHSVETIKSFFKTIYINNKLKKY